MKFLSSLLLLLVVAESSHASDAARPNVLMIFTDDQGVNDVGCYGSEIATPEIDSLARDGLKLNQFYAASSICTPSRFGLLTGRFAQRSVDQLTSALMFLAPGDAERGIRTGEQTYVSLLKQAGYRTHLVGKWHLGHGQEVFWPTEHGFDTFFGHTGGCVDFFTCHYANQPDWYRGSKLVETTQYATDVITDEAAKVIRAKADDQAPWYLHVAYNAPHFGKGWDAENREPQNIMQPKPEDLEKVKHIKDPLRRAFAAKVIGLDEGIGTLLAALKETGQAENTLVIFMTDHGGDERYGGSNQPLRGGKATLFEGGVRVPCLIRWPGVVQPGTESDDIASAIDWFPTLVRVCGLKQAAKPMDGQSILPILRGEDSTSHVPIVWSTGSHAELGRKAWFAVRDGKWKWVRPPGEGEMLFDLQADPGEKRNVAKQHPEMCSKMRKLAEASVTAN